MKNNAQWRRLTALPAMTGTVAQRYLATAHGNLAVLDWDGDFLKPFVEKTGGVGGYVGLGKSFEGLSRMAAHLRDPKLLALRRHALDVLAKAQGRDGYLGIFPSFKRIHTLWDVHEMAYVLMALAVDWGLFGEQRSLRMTRRLADYLVRRVPEMDDSAATICPELTKLGLDRALIAAYYATGNRGYLDFIVKKLRLPEWRLDIVTGRHGLVAGHAYAWLTRHLAQLELFNITGDRRLLRQTPVLLRHLLEDNGLLITGAVGLKECWDKHQAGVGDVGETCATAYLIRVAEMLLRMGVPGGFAGLMERSIYNALFAAQSPDGRKLRYYVPLQGARAYWGRDTYCCPGNFRRIMAELPGMIYHQNADALRVNLYEASTVNVIMGGDVPVAVALRTQYPAAGQVTLEIRPARPVAFEIQLRIPGWCQKAELRVNGKKQSVPRKDGYVGVKRLWQAGDQVDMEMDMPWRMVAGAKSQTGRGALMRGPLVYCAAPADSPAFSSADFTRIAVDPRTHQAAPGRSDAPFGPVGRIKGVQTDPYTGKTRRGWLHFKAFPNPAGQFVYFPGVVFKS